MGTKEALANEIAGTFRTLPSGPLLDLFAGMSAVGRAAADERNVWVNDVQAFSRLISEFQFLGGGNKTKSNTIVREVLSEADDRVREMEIEFGSQLRIEYDALKPDNSAVLVEFEAAVRDSFKPELFDGARPNNFSANNYRLFSDRYASSYFSLRQCIDIDALRYGIDVVLPEDDVARVGLRRRMLAALGSAVSKCSNSTGHFAQYLTPSADNAKRVASQRRRAIRVEWMRSFALNNPIGKSDWRQKNKVFSSDAGDLLGSLRNRRRRPAIVYADPPYTSDQYSRYYHILETLILYDYPVAEGKGRYRTNRFVSSWSLKAKVEACFVELVERSSAIGASLVVSYPHNGLLKDSEKLIPSIMRERYSSVRRLSPVSHHHSTMGASKGAQRNAVLEQIFVAS